MSKEYVSRDEMISRMLAEIPLMDDVRLEDEYRSMFGLSDDDVELEDEDDDDDDDFFDEVDGLSNDDDDDLS